MCEVNLRGTGLLEDLGETVTNSLPPSDFHQKYAEHGICFICMLAVNLTAADPRKHVMYRSFQTCKTFLNMDLYDRAKLVHMTNICEVCLGSNHFRSTCQAPTGFQCDGVTNNSTCHGNSLTCLRHYEDINKHYDFGVNKEPISRYTKEELIFIKKKQVIMMMFAKHSRSEILLSTREILLADHDSALKYTRKMLRDLGLHPRNVYDFSVGSLDRQLAVYDNSVDLVIGVEMSLEDGLLVRGTVFDNMKRMLSGDASVHSLSQRVMCDGFYTTFGHFGQTGKITRVSVSLVNKAKLTLGRVVFQMARASPVVRCITKFLFKLIFNDVTTAPTDGAWISVLLTAVIFYCQYRGLVGKIKSMNVNEISIKHAPKKRNVRPKTIQEEVFNMFVFYTGINDPMFYANISVLRASNRVRGLPITSSNIVFTSPVNVEMDFFLDQGAVINSLVFLFRAILMNSIAYPINDETTLIGISKEALNTFAARKHDTISSVLKFINVCGLDPNGYREEVVDNLWENLRRDRERKRSKPKQNTGAVPTPKASPDVSLDFSDLDINDLLKENSISPEACSMKNDDLPYCDDIVDFEEFVLPDLNTSDLDPFLSSTMLEADPDGAAHDARQFTDSPATVTSSTTTEDVNIYVDEKPSDESRKTSTDRECKSKGRKNGLRSKKNGNKSLLCDDLQSTTSSDSPKKVRPKNTVLKEIVDGLDSKFTIEGKPASPVKEASFKITGGAGGEQFNVKLSLEES